MHQWNCWPFFQLGPIIEIWFCKQNCKMAYVLALPMDICEILMNFLIHILKALDISYWKMQEKIEKITNHILQFWTKIPKNGYCALPWAAQTAQTEEFMFQNVAYRPTVYKTGEGALFFFSIFCRLISKIEVRLSYRYSNPILGLSLIHIWRCRRVP